MRWRFLNTLTTRNINKNQIRTSKSLIQSRTPEQIILITDNVIMMNNKFILNRIIGRDDLGILNSMRYENVRAQNGGPGSLPVLGLVNNFTNIGDITEVKATWNLTQNYKVTATQGRIYGQFVGGSPEDIYETTDVVNDSNTNTININSSTRETIKNSLEDLKSNIFGNKLGIPESNNPYAQYYQYTTIMKYVYQNTGTVNTGGFVTIDHKFTVPYTLEYNITYFPYIKFTLNDFVLPFMEGVYHTHLRGSTENGYSGKLSNKDILSVKFSPTILNIVLIISGIRYNFSLSSNERTKIIPIPFPKTYEIYEISDDKMKLQKYSFISENTDKSQIVALGEIDKIMIFDNKDLRSKIKIKDKFGKIYIKNETIYNIFSEKGTILKYKPLYNVDNLVSLMTPKQGLTVDPIRFSGVYINNVLNFIMDFRSPYQDYYSTSVSYPVNSQALLPVGKAVSTAYWDDVEGEQLYQEYKYENFGKTFSIFKDRYAVIGTTEGKVIIKHLNEKSASEAILNCGSIGYNKFGSVIRTGKYIYINSPQQNKIFLVENVPYYE